MSPKPNTTLDPARLLQDPLARPAVEDCIGFARNSQRDFYGQWVYCSVRFNETAVALAEKRRLPLDLVKQAMLTGLVDLYRAERARRDKPAVIPPTGKPRGWRRPQKPAPCVEAEPETLPGPLLEKPGRSKFR